MDSELTRVASTRTREELRTVYGCLRLYPLTNTTPEPRRART